MADEKMHCQSASRRRSKFLEKGALSGQHRLVQGEVQVIASTHGAQEVSLRKYAHGGCGRAGEGIAGEGIAGINSESWALAWAFSARKAAQRGGHGCCSGGGSGSAALNSASSPAFIRSESFGGTGCAC